MTQDIEREQRIKSLGLQLWYPSKETKVITSYDKEEEGVIRILAGGTVILCILSILLLIGLLIGLFGFLTFVGILLGLGVFLFLSHWVGRWFVG